MAKNNNLGDFLAGIANKIRGLLGTTDPINPQDFEDKIQGVYDKGFSEGGPTGITATDADVLTGKVFGSGGNAKSTGTMPDRGQYQYGHFGSGTNYVAINALPEGYYHSDGQSWAPEARISNSDMASGIGLTAAKIAKGNTILGISGSSVPVACAYGTLYTNLGKGEGVIYPLSGTAKGGLSFASKGIKLIAGTYVGVVACDRNNLNVESVRKNGSNLPLTNIGNIKVRFVNQFNANTGDIITIYMGGLPDYSCDMTFMFVRIA